MADPGFPIGGAPTRWGNRPPSEMCAKMKELDPVGGGRAPARPLDPLMTSVTFYVSNGKLRTQKALMITLIISK